MLVLVSAGVDSLTVRWSEGFAPGAAGFRLRWRERPAPAGGELVWASVDVDASVREYTLGGLAAGTPYRLWLNAVDGDGTQGALVLGSFMTLAPPPGNLTVAAVTGDGVVLGWDSPPGWEPVSYVLRWRLVGGEFSGEAPLGSEVREHAVSGLGGGEYVFRLTARTAAGRESDPATRTVTIGGGDGVLVLASAGVDTLTVRWAERFAPDAAGYRLRWRPRPAPDDGELVWHSADVDGSVRSFTLGDLAAGTPYRLRLNAVDGDGTQGASAVADFKTLAPPPRNLTASVLAHDAVALNWDTPAGWAPVGYRLQWRLGGSGEFLAHLDVPPGRRTQTVTDLTGAQEYVFRLTARTTTGHHSDPATTRRHHTRGARKRPDVGDKRRELLHRQGGQNYQQGLPL